MALSRRPAAALVLAAVSALAACGGSEDPAGAPTALPSAGPETTPAPAVSVSATPTAPPASLLSGRPGVKDGTTLFVKIDNTRPAHPQVGLEDADVVYIEQVEGGLTRLAAVFSTRVPARIGPVRSARTTDLELMRQYGEPAFAFSGANERFLPSIARAPVVELSPDQLNSAYTRDSGRRSPYNLFVSGRKLLAAATGADRARDIGFRFGEPPAGGRATKSATVTYAGARVGFTWSTARKRWLWSMDGSAARNPAGSQLGSATVLVQYVALKNSGYRDVNRNPTPHSETVGEGTGVLLRDGRSWPMSWSRPTAAGGTTYTVAGQRANFHAGEVWVVLAPVGRTARLG